MESLRLDDPSNFDSKVAELLAASSTGKIFVLFFGREVPETGESWCPDCVLADPVIRLGIDQYAKKNGVKATLVEVPVDRRPKDDQPVPETNVYRTRQDIKLGAVPTLLVWTKDGPGKRIVEEECYEAADVEKFAATD
ncbi:hypothetical protein GQ42DRAFT_162755 [Ramicandelaber brevisporus]|nr:hypothetical protein GQ42DRAFT_162755 [Ramicandelaber brevisporus]